MKIFFEIQTTIDAVTNITLSVVPTELYEAFEDQSPLTDANDRFVKCLGKGVATVDYLDRTIDKWYLPSRNFEGDTPFDTPWRTNDIDRYLEFLTALQIIHKYMEKQFDA